jgi:hypothetical protein
MAKGVAEGSASARPDEGYPRSYQLHSPPESPPISLSVLRI